MANEDPNTPDTPPANTPETPPANTPPAPQQPTPQLPQQPSAHESAYSSRELAESINALPERIIAGLREAFTPPQSTPATPPASADTKTTEQTEAKAPGKKTYRSFGHRWFGIAEES